MSRLAFYLGILCCFFLGSCGKSSSNYDAKIALDPSWYALGAMGRENAITVFSTELIEAIGAEEGLKIGVYERSWDNLILGLQSGDYEAICTPMQPYLFYEKLYTFSDIYLATGPVLVVAAGSSWTSLDQLKGREVGILRGSSNALLLEKYPDVIQRTYDSVQQALMDVKQNTLDAMLLDILSAEAFVNDLFAGQLKISSPPLIPEGLRWVGLQGKSEKLIHQLDRGLARLKSKGIYKKLAQKWGLSETM